MNKLTTESSEQFTTYYAAAGQNIRNDLENQYEGNKNTKQSVRLSSRLPRCCINTDS